MRCAVYITLSELKGAISWKRLQYRYMSDILYSVPGLIRQDWCTFTIHRV